MIKIQYIEEPPVIDDYVTLYKSTGWKYQTPVTKAVLETALANTWHWVCAYQKERLVGLGRLISDGALYAFVCDLIVLPEFQKQGIGSTMLVHLKKTCMEKNIKRVWLFAAKGKAPFYERHGFDVRPQSMPGMQLKD